MGRLLHEVNLNREAAKAPSQNSANFSYKIVAASNCLILVVKMFTTVSDLATTLTLAGCLASPPPTGFQSETRALQHYCNVGITIVEDYKQHKHVPTAMWLV